MSRTFYWEVVTPTPPTASVSLSVANALAEAFEIDEIDGLEVNARSLALLRAMRFLILNPDDSDAVNAMIETIERSYGDTTLRFRVER